MANETELGYCSSVWSRDLYRAVSVARRLQAGYTVRVGVVVIALIFRAGQSVAAGCPSSAEIQKSIESIELSESARTARFAIPPPVALYRKAAENVGKVWADHEGKKGTAVIAVELAVDLVWKAVNDEDHYALKGSYLPVRYSGVIEGTAHGDRRLLFQYFRQMGIGRWWVTRNWMNRELYESSSGRLWELIWEDEMDGLDRSQLPFDRMGPGVSAVRATRGSWLLVRVADKCTLIEYFSWSEPGGAAALVQGFLIRKLLRRTLLGAVRLAEDHLSSSRSHSGFIRPDGTRLD